MHQIITIRYLKEEFQCVPGKFIRLGELPFFWKMSYAITQKLKKI